MGEARAPVAAPHITAITELEMRIFDKGFVVTIVGVSLRNVTFGSIQID
jgi:hypothetical protein